MYLTALVAIQRFKKNKKNSHRKAQIEPILIPESSRSDAHTQAGLKSFRV